MPSLTKDESQALAAALQIAIDEVGERGCCQLTLEDTGDNRAFAVAVLQANRDEDEEDADEDSLSFERDDIVLKVVDVLDYLKTRFTGGKVLSPTELEAFDAALEESLHDLVERTGHEQIELKDTPANRKLALAVENHDIDDEDDRLEQPRMDGASIVVTAVDVLGYFKKRLGE